MKSMLATAAVVAGLALLATGCSETPGQGLDTPATTSAPLTTTQLATTEVTTPPAPATTTSLPTSWLMPDLVGQNLQAAQDAIQALTDHAVFFTSSTDATGQGRAQVLDSNWQVCSQNVRPGDPITTTTKIEFAAVKLEERCP
jgi:PBP1b-binding outer membrane lipoprotein LpoB